MVSPVYLIIIPIVTAFLLPLIPGAKSKAFVFFSAVLSVSVVSVLLFVQVITTNSIVQSFTSGVLPPLSINLIYSHVEGFVLLFILPIFLFSALLLYPRMKHGGVRNYMVYLTLIAGTAGIILTRDLFNLFVFIEISSISLYSLVVLTGDKLSFEAGFKYIIAGGIASIFYLIGTSYIYRYTGNLNMDFITGMSVGASSLSVLGLFFLFIALIVEIKSVPVNGWAMDVYEAVPGPLGALISVASGSAFIVVFYKTSAFFPDMFKTVGAYIGLAGFLFANIMALSQKDEKRMFGYSSAGYLGLLLFIVLDPFGFGKEFILICGALFIVSHILIKTGLFFLTGRENTNNTVPNFIPLLFSAALSGFPPFPSFWAKWQLVRQLSSTGHIMLVVIILFASLCEVIYLFRWASAKISRNEEYGSIDLSAGFSVILLFAAITIGMWTGYKLQMISLRIILLFDIVLIFLLLDILPGKIKGFLSIIAAGASAYFLYPFIVWKNGLFSLPMFFFLLVSAGALLHLFASMYKKGSKRKGYYASFMLMLSGIWGILVAESSIEFICAWETMALGSYFLVVQTKRGSGPSLLYMGFSAAGAYLMMTGLAMERGFPITDGFSYWLPAVLILCGVLMKLGIIGFHIWTPGTYGEADDDAAGFLSSTMSKIVVFVLLAVLASVSMSGLGIGLMPETLGAVIGWLGVLTAFAATLAAVYQEDIKHLLAYSSLGQIGYIILAVGLMDHFGWTTALYLTLNHFLFKAMLFLAIAGVIYRTGTRLMYKMGGLIKKMPISFISVLMAIIALSGVPPLSGFGSKWLLYNALLEKGWYLQLVLAMFTSTIAFLYLFRLIHAIFLGQLKPEYAEIKEAPVWLIIPQGILIAALMGFSMYPGFVLKPLQEVLQLYFPQTISWDGSTLMSSYGYWNGTLVMYIVMGIFIILLGLLFVIMRKPVGVKQFNIVFAAERPHKPSTTHYAYNFFSPYDKALGFLSRPYGFRVWRSLSDIVLSFASVLRRFYTGNGQTYALHIILFTGIMFLVIFGGYHG